MRTVIATILGLVGRGLVGIVLAGLGLAGVPAMAQDWSGNWVGMVQGYGTGRYQQGVSAMAELGAVVDVQGRMPGLRYVRLSQDGNLVYGFDLGLSGGIDGVAPLGTSGPHVVCASGDCTIDIRQVVTLRGRLGWLITSTTQIYAAAGIAVARVEGGISNSEQQGGSTVSGHTIGLGLAQMLSDRVSAFVEVNRVDLGTLYFGSGGGDQRFDAQGDFSMVSIGVSWRF